MKHGVIGMDVLKSISGLELLQGMIAGRYPPAPISALIGMHLLEVSPGRAVFGLTPSREHYNPLGTVHGGIAATILDSCMACAVQSMLEAGFGYTTIEFKVTCIRPITDQTGPVRGIGEIINVGRRLGVAEGRLVDAQDKVLAHATTSCLVFPL